MHDHDAHQLQSTNPFTALTQSFKPFQIQVLHVRCSRPLVSSSSGGGRWWPPPLLHRSLGLPPPVTTAPIFQWPDASAVDGKGSATLFRLRHDIGRRTYSGETVHVHKDYHVIGAVFQSACISDSSKCVVSIGLLRPPNTLTCTGKILT